MQTITKQHQPYGNIENKIFYVWNVKCKNKIQNLIIFPMKK